MKRRCDAALLDFSDYRHIRELDALSEKLMMLATGTLEGVYPNGQLPQLCAGGTPQSDKLGCAERGTYMQQRV